MIRAYYTPPFLYLATAASARSVSTPLPSLREETGAQHIEGRSVAAGTSRRRLTQARGLQSSYKAAPLEQRRPSRRSVTSGHQACTAHPRGGTGSAPQPPREGEERS